MRRINYWPIVGGRCNKPEIETRIKLDTFFLAEPFKPLKERERRERVVGNALKGALARFSEDNLIVADKEPKDPAIFCNICRLIQCSSYGIVDISGLNPNALLELGMLVALGKPVFVLVKEEEEESLREKLPSDIVWKRVVPYEEYVDIEEKLCKQVKNRPKVETEDSLVEECAKMFDELDPELAQAIDTKLKETRKEQAERLESLEKLLKKTKMSNTISVDEKTKIPRSLEKQIDKLSKSVDRIERLVGFTADPKTAFMRGNWHYRRKEYDKALELYDWVLTIKPDDEDAWNNKGVVLGELGKHKKAIACYDKALEIKPDDEEAWYNKGVALGKLGKHKKAIACYDKALEIKPEYEKARRARTELGDHER